MTEKRTYYGTADVIRKALYDCAQAVADGTPAFDAAYQAAVELGLEEASVRKPVEDEPSPFASSLSIADSYIEHSGSGITEPGRKP